MYKSKNRNKIIKPLKIVSWLMTMFFVFIAYVFAREVTPFNALNQWVDKVEKNLEINSLQGKAVIKNLYNTSLDQVKLTSINPMLQSVKQTRAALNDNYLCNLKDDDLVNILYKSNDEFKKNLKNLSSNFTKPKNSDVVDSCSKLMGCMLSWNKRTKITDTLSYCKLIVNDYYLDNYRNSYDSFSLSKWNEWLDAFWNRNLDDSSYDILNDVYVLAKILFESPEEPTEILYYKMPNVSPGAPTLWDLIDYMSKNWFSPYYTNNSSGGNSGWDNGNNWWINNPNEWWTNHVMGEYDDEILDFVEETNASYSLEDGEWYEYLWDDCISWFNIDWYSEVFYTQEEDNPALTESDYTDAWQMIVENIDQLSCNHNGFCDNWESVSCEDCIQWSSWWNQWSWWNGDNSLNDFLSILDQQTQTCFSSCSNIPCTATSCDRLTCYAKCLCISYESPFFDPVENLWLWTLFKIKFCIQPVMDHKVTTTKKVFNLASIISEINTILQNLRNSWELMLNKKTREYMEAWFLKNNFAKQISFSINSYDKVSQPKWSEKQEKENQINLNTSMMENILWFDKQETTDGQWRNKYVIKWGSKQQEAIALDEETDKYIYSEVDDADIITSLQAENIWNIDSQIYDFLSANLDFWMSVKSNFESFNATAQTLANKKD